MLKSKYSSVKTVQNFRTDSTEAKYWTVNKNITNHRLPLRKLQMPPRVSTDEIGISSMATEHLPAG